MSRDAGSCLGKHVKKYVHNGQFSLDGHGRAGSHYQWVHSSQAGDPGLSLMGQCNEQQCSKLTLRMLSKKPGFQQHVLRLIPGLQRPELPAWSNTCSPAGLSMFRAEICSGALLQLLQRLVEHCMLFHCDISASFRYDA